MPQTKKSQNRKTSKNKVFLRGGFWWITFGALALIGVVICYSRSFTKETEQYTFVAQGTLNILIVAAVIVQALIYRRQWDVMEQQSRDSQRAYVGIKDITVPYPQNSRNPWLIIQNIGNLPADEVRVEIQIIGLIPPSTFKKYPDHALKSVYTPEMPWLDFMRSRLSREGVCFDVEIPLEELLGPVFLMCMSNGYARLIIQVRLKYWDGFEQGESDYAFRWDSGWKSWPVWAQDDLPSRISEEQGRYNPN